MRVIESVEQTIATCRELRRQGRRIGFVPTMGALHEGHLALVRAAKTQSDAVVVSIFVNPTQFGLNEDFAQYPRPLEHDRKLLEAEQVDVLFTPTAEEMYAPGASTFVDVEGVSGRLDGKSRPGHFRGVATVVAKLFHIVQPDAAFFGQKDAAQVAVLKQMVRDLHFDLRLVIVPTVRETGGLAMSSRNAYLSPEERKQALVLGRALNRAQALADTGERSADKLVAAMRAVFAEQPQVAVDYVEVVNPDTLLPVSDISSGALVAVAAKVGATRLIDNIVLLGAGTSRGPA
jgi:pantoate--beta-alanine ligase